MGTEKTIENQDTRPSLSTSRLDLRPFQIEDEEAVFEICREKAIAASTRTIPHPYPRAQAEHWIKQHPEMWLDGKAAVFAICNRLTGRLIGAVGLQIDREDQNAELGYWIDKTEWGQGYCTEAAQETIRFAFEELSLHKVHAHFMTSNPASGRVMEKIGMKQEGVLRGHVRKWGQFHDIVFYGLLKKDFMSCQK
ncbi:MAG: GNAT family N-acetyltransferase [Planctomycetota bacterium]